MGEVEDIYQFHSLIRTEKLELESVDYMFICSLPSIMLQNKVTDFADYLLKALSKHPRFTDIGRVSLAKRLGFSNQIRVVSSANHDPSNFNRMPMGYSCFVDENGSLLSMQPGTVRTYKSARDIVESFHLGKRPPQRSIQRISQMSFQSGMVIPLFNSENFMHGALFLNFSNEMPLFKHKGDFYLMSLLETQANLVIYQQQTAFFSQNNIPKKYWFGQTYRYELIEEALKSTNVSVKLEIVNEPTEKFIVSPGMMALFFLNLARYTWQTKLRVSIAIEKDHGEVSFSLLDTGDLRSQEEIVRNVADSFGMRFIFENGQAIFFMPYEAINEDHILYSTENGEQKSLSRDNLAKDSPTEQTNDLKIKFLSCTPSDLVQLVCLSYIDNPKDTEVIGLETKVYNDSVGNTGSLLIYSGIAIHIIEGVQRDIGGLLEKIQNDSRICELQIYFFQKVEARRYQSFGWKENDSSSIENEFANEIIDFIATNTRNTIENWEQLLERFSKNAA